MKTFNSMFAICIFLFITDLPITAARDAKCFVKELGEYYHCPLCGPGIGLTADPGWIDTVKYSNKTLISCNGKPLNIKECAHQCSCNWDNKLACRGWNGCHDYTVTNYCKCIWSGSKDSCVDDTFNKKYDDGGICYCPPYDTGGTPPGG